MKRLLFLIFLLTSALIQAQEKFTVFFETSAFELKESEVDRLAQWIQTNRDSKIIAMHGFTDDVGGFGYNDTLSVKRVQNMYALLKPYLKIRSDFSMQSFGKNHKQSKNKAENRRVDIFYLKKQDLALEHQILGIKRVAVPADAPLIDKIRNAWVGDKIEVEKLFFHLNTFAMLPESKPAMDNLTQIMKDLPNLKIEIQGHICCQTKDHNNLSLQRAKQIKRLLVANGIDENRIQSKGFGSSQAKFAIPENSEAERAANRRVEIEILEN